MISRDDQPDTPDWTPQPGNRCAGCDAGVDKCWVIQPGGECHPCCAACSHGTHAVVPEVMLWEGDQA